MRISEDMILFRYRPERLFLAIFGVFQAVSDLFGITMLCCAIPNAWIGFHQKARRLTFRTRFRLRLRRSDVQPLCSLSLSLNLDLNVSLSAFDVLASLRSLRVARQGSPLRGSSPKPKPLREHQGKMRIIRNSQYLLVCKAFHRSFEQPRHG